MNRVLIFAVTSLIFLSALHAESESLQMVQKRKMHRSLLLDDRYVLITGGVSTTWPIPWLLKHAELYDTQRKRFIPLESMYAKHVEHTMTQLPNRDVIIAGGNLGPYIERYDSRTDTFHGMADLKTPRFSHTAHIGPNENLYLMGGYEVELNIFDYNLLSKHALTSALFRRKTGPEIIPLKHIEIYNLRTETSRLVPYPDWFTRMYFHRSAQLPNGNIIIAGGMGTRDKVIEFNVHDETWRLRGKLRVGREDHAMILMDSGELIISGGTNAEAKTLRSLEVFDLNINAGALLSFGMVDAREDHSMIQLSDLRFAVLGGEVDGNPDIIVESAEIFDLAQEGHLFYSSGFFPNGRSDHQTTKLPDGSLLITGGEDQGAYTLQSAILFTP